MYFADQIQGVYRMFFIFNPFLSKKHCSSLHDIHPHCGFEPMIASDLLYGSLADINGYRDCRNWTVGEPNSRLKVIMALNSAVSYYLFGKHYFYQSICIRILALSCLVCKSWSVLVIRIVLIRLQVTQIVNRRQSWVQNHIVSVCDEKQCFWIKKG